MPRAIFLGGRIVSQLFTQPSKSHYLVPTKMLNMFEVDMVRNDSGQTQGAFHLTELTGQTGHLEELDSSTPSN